MSKITISLRLEEETIELLKIGAMLEGLRRGNYDLSYTDLIEQAINEAYGPYLFQEARKEKLKKADIKKCPGCKRIGPYCNCIVCEAIKNDELRRTSK